VRAATAGAACGSVRDCVLTIDHRRDAIGGVALLLRQQMAILLEREGFGGVAEPTGHDVRWHACGEEQRRVSVARVMQPETRRGGALGEPLEPLRDDVAVQTDDGQASLSLDGRLPPGWPSAFPTPSHSDPAGSGSLTNGGGGGLVGAYATSKLPAEVHDFYKTKAPLTVTSSSSIGAGSAFVGSLKFGGSYSGSSVTIVSAKNDTKKKSTRRISFSS
jgi:hypothetical protein